MRFLHIVAVSTGAYRPFFTVAFIAFLFLLTATAWGATPNVTREEDGDGTIVAFPYISAGSFTTHIPSNAARGKGIAVRLFYPSADAIRYPEGAPVMVFAPGGHGPGSLPEEGVNYEVATNGYILIYFLLPGGSSIDGTSSGGAYDYRGRSSKRALADVIRYALGKIPDTNGQRLQERLPFALSSNVGVIGTSNGGNLAITTFADYGAGFLELAWFAAAESPIGDQTIVNELDSGEMLNAFYVPGTSAVKTCPLPGLADALSFDYTARFQLEDPAIGIKHEVQGVLFFDSNSNNRFDTGEYSFTPLGGPGVIAKGQYMPKGYISAELAAAVQSQYARLFPSGAPPWLATRAEVEAYWAERDGSLAISRAHVVLPNLLVLDIATTDDHAQKQPDHPHIRSFMQGWINAGHSFVRLNPDSAYMAWLTGWDTSNFPDNGANNYVPYPNIEPTLEPETVSGTSISTETLHAAAILELCDRVRMNSRSPDLDAVLFP